MSSPVGSPTRTSPIQQQNEFQKEKAQPPKPVDHTVQSVVHEEGQKPSCPACGMGGPLWRRS